MQDNTHKKSIIKQNILQYLKYKRITPYVFYKKTGITRGVLSQDNGLSENNLFKFLSVYSDLNFDWLFFGKGEMLKKCSKQDNSTTIKETITEPKKTNIVSETLAPYQGINEYKERIKELKQHILTQNKYIEMLEGGEKKSNKREIV